MSLFNTSIVISLYTVLMFCAIGSAQNVTDDFSSGNYTGGANWLSNWSESDSGGASGGYIRVSSQQLRFNYLWNETIQRSTNIATATSATLSLDWSSSNLSLNKDLDIQISNGSGGFTHIGSVGGLGISSGTFSFDISAYISANTTIKIGNDEVSSGNWSNSNATVLLDNIVIAITSVPVPVPNDNDGDLIVDALDLDDDNDGIPDVLEYCSTTELSDLPSINAGGDRTISYTHTDTGYLQFDFMTLDNSFQFSVNGTNIHNRILQFESGAYNSGTEVLMRTAVGGNLLYSPWVVNTNGLPRIRLIIGEEGQVQVYATRNSNSTALELLVTSDGSLFNTLPWVAGSANNFLLTNPDEGGPEGLTGNLFLGVICDTDGDGISNKFDLDSDNDGIYDVVESGALSISGVNDADNNGVIDGNILDFGINGLHDSLEDADTFTPELEYTISDSDSDLDYDAFEIDADNDQCFDVVEAGYTDGDNDGILGSSPVTVDPDNGLVTSGVDGYTTPGDFDANGVFDFQEAGAILSVTTQPVDQQVLVGNTASFTVVANNGNIYQWQVSTNGGVSYNKVTDGPEYSGSQSATLNVIEPQPNKNQYVYRV
ncbi:hypothetical protein [Maribacter ulvicola]|uniref:Uncharacterized protein n=1 Tax=Maribacter ulvicola TaxID=228959 RepID=A0A1N6QDX3_9FLAO|nr:hypothetical protein [Maribacter ulvicola]SIQ14797.1 hypothetical protein SAMN05421797_101857 [Maribacter ulvicola]